MENSHEREQREQEDSGDLPGRLQDDVQWEIPGFFHVVGKQAFDEEIENDAFVGQPTITLTRLVEENDVVVAEGLVRVQRNAGGLANLAFCVFEMQGS